MSNHGIIRLVKKAYGGIARLVFPPSCVFCGIDLQSDGETKHAEQDVVSRNISNSFEAVLCNSCVELLTPNYSATCQACGAGLTATPPNSILQNGQDKTLASDNGLASDSAILTGDFNPQNSPHSAQRLVGSCIHCRRSRMQFQQCYALGNYEKGVRDAVLRIKSGSSDPLAAVLAQLIANKILATGLATKTLNKKPSFDVVLPIPIFWRRRLTRNTVVSELIAERIAQKLRVPFDRKVLRYNRLTKKQGTLSNTERTKNVAGAIELISAKKIESKTVLIVDDVMTSGATLNEASKVCLQAGACEVYVAIVARGIGLSLTK